MDSLAHMTDREDIETCVKRWCLLPARWKIVAQCRLVLDAISWVNSATAPIVGELMYYTVGYVSR